ncbi:MAG TPA: prolipoprotein diacylglyceryl transferase family protein [Polyangiaceae bacterium]|nr:prolipoprotein diacylglyceryl transferase family protein [Polyangiaceae bacterium]
MSAAPLFPYIILPELTLVPAHAFRAFPPVPISIKPFGALVATGVYLASYLTVKRARRIGLDERVMTSFIAWVVGVGFVGGHVLDEVFYYPQRLLQDPLSLFKLWDGLSSFGGFTGAFIGMLIWRSRYRVPVLPYADNVMALLPVGWVFGRAGCSTAHDHPGLLSDSLFAVRYPGGSRFDLGLLELLLTIPLALAFLYLGKKPRPWGFFSALGCVVYAPLRFALDFLREHDSVPGDLHGAIDPRYFYLTPAQWECFALLGFGIYLLTRVMSAVGRGEGFERPVLPSAFDALPTATSDSNT